MDRRVVAAATTLALAALLAACGGSTASTSAGSGGGSTATSSATSSTPAATGAAAAAPAGPLAVAAAPSGQLAFTHTSLSAKAGTVTIRFTNAAPVGHNLTIQQGTSGRIIAATPTFQGGARTLKVHLAPGTYTFFCSVPGHRMAGMQGTLTVR